MLRWIEPIAQALGLPPRLAFEIVADAFQSYEAFADAVSITLRYYERDLRRSPYRFAEEVVNTFLSHARVSPSLFYYLTSRTDSIFGTEQDSSFVQASDGSFSSPQSVLFGLPFFHRVEDQLRTLVRRFVDVVLGAIRNLRERGYHVLPRILFADDDVPEELELDESSMRILETPIETRNSFIEYAAWLLRHPDFRAQRDSSRQSDFTSSIRLSETALGNLPPFIRALAQSELFLHFVSPDGTPTSAPSGVGLGYSIRVALYRDPVQADEKRRRAEFVEQLRIQRSSEASAFWSEFRSDPQLQKMMIGLIAASGSISDGFFASRCSYLRNELYRDACRERFIVPARTPFLKWLFSPYFRRRVASHLTFRAHEQVLRLLEHLPSSPSLFAMEERDYDRLFESHQEVANDFFFDDPRNVADVPAIVQFCHLHDVPSVIVLKRYFAGQNVGKKTEESFCEFDWSEWETNFEVFCRLFQGCDHPSFKHLWDSTDRQSSERDRYAVIYNWVTGREANFLDPVEEDAVSILQNVLFDMMIRNCSDGALRDLISWAPRSSQYSRFSENLLEFCRSLLTVREQMRQNPTAPYEYASNEKMQSKHQKRSRLLVELRQRVLEAYDIDEDALGQEVERVRTALLEHDDSLLSDVTTEEKARKIRFVLALDQLLTKEGLEKWYEERAVEFRKEADDYVEHVDSLNKEDHLRLYNAFGIRNGDRSSDSRIQDGEDSDEEEEEESSDSDNETLELQDPIRYSRTWMSSGLRRSLRKEVRRACRDLGDLASRQGMAVRDVLRSRGQSSPSNSSSSEDESSSVVSRSQTSMKPWERARTARVSGSSTSSWLSYSSSTYRSASRVKLSFREKDKIPFRLSNRRFTVLDELRDVSRKIKALERIRRRHARMVIREVNTPYPVLQEVIQDDRRLETRRIDYDSSMDELMEQWDRNRFKVFRSDATGLARRTIDSQKKSRGAEDDDSQEGEEAED